MLLEDNTEVIASSVLMERCKPAAGDYWIIEENGGFVQCTENYSNRNLCWIGPV